MQDLTNRLIFRDFFGKLYPPSGGYGLFSRVFWQVFGVQCVAWAAEPKKNARVQVLTGG
jgi:hypothetical protein